MHLKFVSEMEAKLVVCIRCDCFEGGEKQPFENNDVTEDGTLGAPPVKRLRVDDAPVSRVSLLLSREQMVRDGYPLPYSQSGQLQFGLTSVLSSRVQEKTASSLSKVV